MATPEQANNGGYGSATSPDDIDVTGSPSQGAMLLPFR